MKLGADKKRLAMLGGLILIGGYVLWSNVLSSDSSSTSAGASTPAPVALAPVPAANSTRQTDIARLAARRNRTQRPAEWNPTYPDPKTVANAEIVDPTLRLDLLSKVQQVEISGSQRNLFQFGEAAKPATPLTPLPSVKKIDLAKQQNMPPPAPPGPPPAPVAPPISLKYYGYSSVKASTHKRAFFLDGEDIIVASEGELIKRRYRLVKIGVNSVTMEDTQFKTEQTLPLAQELAG